MWASEAARVVNNTGDPQVNGRAEIFDVDSRSTRFAIHDVIDVKDRHSMKLDAIGSPPEWCF